MLERELRSLRPQPRDECVEMIAGSLDKRAAPSRLGKLGVVLAVTGLVAIAVGSFGGIGYASGTSAGHKLTSHKLTSSADAQYAPAKPPAKKPSGAGTGGAGKGGSGTGGAAAGKPTTKPSSGLPFTGLDLWAPVVGGIVLVMLGLGLRWQGRRRPAVS